MCARKSVCTWWLPWAGGEEETTPEWPRNSRPCQELPGGYYVGDIVFSKVALADSEGTLAIGD